MVTYFISELILLKPKRIWIFLFAFRIWIVCFMFYHKPYDTGKAFYHSRNEYTIILQKRFISEIEFLLQYYQLSKWIVIETINSKASERSSSSNFSTRERIRSYWTSREFQQGVRSCRGFSWWCGWVIIVFNWTCFNQLLILD